jgi:hypothetical protein
MPQIYPSLEIALASAPSLFPTSSILSIALYPSYSSFQLYFLSLIRADFLMSGREIRIFFL